MGRIACNAEDWNSQSQPGTRPFSAQAGSISFISVLLLFAIIVFKYHLASPARRRDMFKSHVDVYMFNLFIGELLMSLGGILDAKWAHETQVYCGGYCNAQASLQFLGETSVSIWTLAITAHTGWSVVYAKRLDFRPWFCFGVVAAVWIYVFAFNFGAHASANAVGDDDPANYFAPTPFWCWISSAHKAKKFAEYIWLWLAGVGNIVVYVPLFLLLRGEEGDVREHCWRMLYYPAAYTILVLPVSVVRWMGFTHRSSAASLATAQITFHALYRLSGVINVALVIGTRPGVLLLDEEEDQPQPADGGRNADSNSLLEQQANAGQPMEQVGGMRTGFGGPAVNLSQGDD
ncbi:hypothetical protein FRC06_008006 [Ceratobasidium sp. 370]|nr:hypothetical protein FRC06_008006 [Ceratobasidium sp. 370]